MRQHPICGDFLARDDVVSQRLEFVGEVRIGMRLDGYSATIERPHARCIQSFLKVHSTIENIDDDLNLSLRLHIGAHAAKGHFKGTIGREHHGGNDRVAHALAWSGMIRMGCIHLKISPPIVEDDSGSGNDDAGAEHVGNACDQGNSIAIAIDDREIRRVSIDSPGSRIIERAVSLDQPTTPAEGTRPKGDAPRASRQIEDQRRTLSHRQNTA